MTTKSPPPSIQKAARPCPPNLREQHRVLHSIYQAIDAHNYAKVLKLTSPSPASSSTSSSAAAATASSDRWDIVRALRIHALERCGKVREALLLMWEVVAGDVVVGDSSAAATAAVISSTQQQQQYQQQRQTWSELYQRIQALTTAEDIVIHEGHSSSSSNTNRNGGGTTSYHRSLGEIQLLDAVQRLDIRSFAPIVNPYMANNNDSKKDTTVTTTAAATAFKSSKAAKGGGGGKKSKSSSDNSNSNSIIFYPPVTDETVLQTLAVTLRNCELFDTMSEMYHQASTALSSSPSSSSKSSTSNNEEDVEQQEENYRNLLEEGVCVHFRAVCDCTSFGVNLGGGSSNPTSTNGGIDDKGIKQGGWDRITLLQSQLPKLQSLLNMTKYYARMQTSSLQLAKVTAQPLHFQWTAISSLWYKESLERLVSILEYIQTLLPSNIGDHDNNCKGGDIDCNTMLSLLVRQVLNMMDIGDSSEITSQISSYRQKMALLPRLAESLSSRMVLSSQQTPSDSSASVVASENDWDVYLETLLVQGKKLEALDVLKNIYCTPMVGDSSTGLPPTTDGDEDSSRRHGIVDEGTINNHVGSMLRYTRRKQLERMAQLSHELDMFTNAEGYYRELLLAFPDQWTYWMGLVESSCVRPSSSSLSDGEERIVSIDKAGRQRCHSFAKEIASNNVDKHTLRGPLLVLVELAALELRQAPSHSTINEVDERRRLMALLRDEICEYGNRFGSQASCCFSDVRSYLRLLVQASLSGGEITGISDIPNEVSHLLEWARGMWVSNAQSTDTGSLEVEDELRERRKKLRSFIFAVQVVYGIAAEMKDLTLHLLQTFAPSTSQLVLEWRTSLVSLPIVAAKDGGQKEVLPGDEIILLASQYLLFQASLHPPSSNESNHSSTTMLLQSAALLEESMDHSPYNPHLKIAAISVYSKLNAAGRALSIFQDMGVKQIQLDSCSYIILPLLIRGGLYASAIKLSTSILRLHGSTSKDVKTYSSKSLQNGLMLKAKEMVTFQCEKMRPSLQLLYSKGLLLDNAPLMIASDLENETLAVTTQKGKSPAAGLAAEKGFCGKEEDLMRAEQLAIDAEIHVNAPAIVHTSAQSSSIENFSSSDNRDKTVNYFEVLSHTSHLSHLEIVVESLRRGHVHGLLARAIMAAGTATAPKKGKLVKPTVESAYRCQSLRYALLRANDFGHNAIMDEVDRALWNTCCQLCEVINVVIYGSSCDESTDTIAGREALAVSVINSTTELIQSARQAFTSCNSAVDTTEKRTLMGGKVCRLLPDYIVPSFILLETTSRLFSLFGWGKRKRLTKAASGSLALAAISLQDFILDMLHFLADFRSVSGNIQSLVEAATSPELGKDAVQRVVGEVVSSRELTKDRVDFFLVEMMDGLQCFNEEL